MAEIHIRHARLHAVNSTADHSASGLTAGNALVATGPTTFAWGQVDHLNLANIGTNTHAQIDTALTRLANTSGTNTGDQTLSGLGGVPTTRNVNTTAPLTGGGALSADLTLVLATTANLAVTTGNLDTAQGIQTNSSPTFAGLTVGSLGGILKGTAGVLGVALAADFPTLNQDTTGSSGSCTGNAATVTNATLTTSLTNNGGAGILTWPATGATLTIPSGGGTLGSAAFTAATAYDVSGAASTVQANLNTHTAITADAHGSSETISAHLGLGTVVAYTDKLSVVGGVMGLYQFSSDASTAAQSQNKARGTEASPTIVLLGDTLGNLNFRGWDGAAWRNAVQVVASVDATPGNAIMPGRLEIYVSPPGTSTGYQALTVFSSRNTVLGATADGMTAGGSLAIAQDLAHRGTKVGFYNVTPVTKPAALTAQLTTVTYTAPVTPNYALTGTAVTNTTPWGLATSDDVNTLLSVVANLQARLAAMETNLKNFGLFS